MKPGMIIVIAGPTASGKTTAAKHATETYGAYRAKYSDILIELARSQNLPLEKDSLQKLSTELRHTKGEDFLTKQMQTRLDSVPNPLIVIEGTRRMVDITFATTFAADQGKELVLIYVDADPEKRFARMNEREMREGKEPLTRPAFDILENDECEEELPLVRSYIEKHGGQIIDNTSLSLDSLKKMIDESIADA